jgi:hypothetical protein
MFSNPRGQEHNKDIYNVTKQTVMVLLEEARMQFATWPGQVNPYKEKEKCGTFWGRPVGAGGGGGGAAPARSR